MNEVMSFDKAATMSSREIADLTGKRHDQVMRDIRNMLEQLKVGAHTYEGSYLSEQNKVLPCFNLDRIHVECLLTGYSVPLRMKVLERMAELEGRGDSGAQNAMPPIPQTYAEALQLAADQAKQLELAAPKVSYYDKVVERETLLNATQVGQKIGLSAVMLNRHLDDLGVYNKSIKRGRAFRQSFVDAGYGIMRQTETGHAQPMITLSGEAWIIEKLTSEGII